MNCRIIYKDNKIDHVQAENGERSILFDSLKDIFGAEKALELYALTEEDGYKQKIQEKVRSFVGVTEKQIDKLSEAIDAQETLNKLVETGLAENVYQLSSEEIEDKLVELGVDTNVTKQVIAYHGSPYTFDRFTTEKMGTGEGAQAFGWGLYFTDLESIAKNYADVLAGKSNIYKVLRDALGNNEDFTFYAEKDNKVFVVKDEYDEYTIYEQDGSKEKNINSGLSEDEIVDEFLTYIDNQYSTKGNFYVNDKNVTPSKNLYKVSLHKGKTPNQYTWLEWDIEVSKTQLEKISENVLDKTLAINTTGIFQFRKNEKFYRGEKTNNQWKFIDRNTGESVEYSEVSNAWQELYNQEVLNKKEFKFYKRLEDFLESDKKASLFLLESGIDGIKYPAESISRGATSDTARGFNYVVFDENTITIEEQIQFQKPGITLITNGFIYKNDVYLNKNADESTMVHEFNHLHNKWLKQNRPEVYKKGLDLVKAEIKKGKQKEKLSKKDTKELKKLLDFKTDSVTIYDENATAEILIEQLSDGEVSLHISEIWSDIKGQGSATKLLNKIQSFSDEYNVAISLRASTNNNIRTSGGLEQEALVKWYEKNSFYISEEDSNFEKDETAPFMVYQPTIAVKSEIQDIIDFVKTNQPNLEGEKLNEEILTEMVGRRGLELLNEQKDKTKSSGIIDYLKQVWQEIKNMLGLSSYTDEQILNMNLQDFANASAIDLLRGEKLGTFSEESNDIRYQVIGEKGASKIKETLGLLDQAKQLENAGEDEITDVVEKSNLPQEVKDEYNKAVTSQDKPGYSKLTKKPSLKIEVKEVNGRLVVEPLVNGTKAGALRMLPYEDGYRVDSVAVYDKYQNKRLGTRLYQEAIKFLLKSQTPLYSLKVRSENAKKIWDKFVAIGVAQKVGEDYIASNKGGLDKNNEAKPSDVMQYANTTDEKLSKEETAEAIDLAVSLGVESSQEAVAILKDAFLENDAFVFDKKKMKKAGYNDYEITKILTDVNLQNQIKNNLAKLENTDFSAPLMDVQTSPEIGIFGKQKVKPKVKTVNVKTVNEQGEVVDKVSDTKELLRKTYPDTLPNDMPQIASSLLKSSENVVNTHNDLFYNTLNDLKNAALDLGVDLKDIENRVFPLENFKSFVNSLMEYYANPSDTFAEVYDEFFENYGAEKATKPTMSTPYTEYELFDKFNLVRNGDEYIKVEDVEIEPSAERQAKISQLEVEDFAVDFDKLEKLVYHKEQLGAEMKTLQKPLIEEINLREVKKNPYLKATSEGVKLVSEDPLTAQKAELYGYEPKVAKKQPKKIETDYSLVQDVLVTQLTSKNKVRTPKGNFTKFMDDNNKSVFLLDGSKQSIVDLEGYLSKADNTPKVEAKKLYSKEEYEENFGCI